MYHKNLKTFFNLEQNELLYSKSITPKSCGGGEILFCSNNCIT